ncbi:MAG: protein translocase subunit SecD [Puniceicoccaceae bacterium]|nr:MAG: protein translocase subunit SecD [Puniceicoccaceae bacterium]
MLGKLTWKLALSVIVVAWAVLYLVPTRDTPFEEYALAQARVENFSSLMERAAQRVEDGTAPTAFIALRDIAQEEQIDLSRYFPQINLEATLVNINRRNEILLHHLLDNSRSALQLGLDLRGGVAFTLEVDPAALGDRTADERADALRKAIQIIGQRVDAYGVAEPVIRPVGDRRIEVQLAGLNTQDNPEVVDALRKPARLDFRLVHPTLEPADADAEPPPGFEVMTMEVERGDRFWTEHLFIKRIPEMTGEMIANAFPSMDEYGNFKVLLRFTSEGRTRFAEITRGIEQENRRTGRLGRMAIVLDGVLYSAPTVRQEIAGGSAEITGQFSRREALDLSNVLNNPLDLPLTVAELFEVGPTLAEDSIRSAQRAAVIAIALVAAFMVTYFTIGGVLALISLSINLIIVLGVLASIGATLTLPGIAGIILTVGMAVDANILIFERIREELTLGKSLPAALQGGFEKVFSTIFDANVTTLMTSGAMIFFGTGPVKGFGITLAIGVFTTMFTALVVSRLLLEMLILPGYLKKLPMGSFLTKSDWDFLQWRKPVFAASWAIVLIGVVTIGIKGEQIYGIDFVGGDELLLEFQERLDIADIRAAVTEAGAGEVNPLYQSQIGGEREILKIQTEFDRAQEVLGVLRAAFPEAALEFVGENRIGPAVGREIRMNAFMAIGISLVLILLYVAFRFEFGYGVGAVVATIHDILLTIGIFVLSDRQFSAPMVAAILLIAGYSLNDTIVVFDRIREELQMNTSGSLKKIVNLAINKVLTRSILTSFTTLLAAGSLYVFGGGVVNDIAFTFIIGILTGTLSSIFIASPVFYWWHRGDRRHVESSHDIAPNYEWVAGSKASR